MTQEEKYINFMLNYNKKLREHGTNWLGPEDLSDVIVQTAEENEPGCVGKILKDIQSLP